MSSPRTGKYKFNARSLKRNESLRGMLLWLKDNPGQSIKDIADEWEWSQPVARNAVETLRQAKLIYVYDTEKSGFHTAINFYAVKPHADFELDLHLPIVRPGHLPAPGSHRLVAKPVVAQPRMLRDPLTELLMGSGRAPSLNFMDSMKGVSDVKPQAACPSH